jgi:nucleoside-diphosphate-sugar epimerase
MRVFVTGATGVIGRRVVPLLLSQGHAVTALVRHREAFAQMQARGVKFVDVDLFSPDAVRQAVSGQTAIINLATHMPPTAFRMLFRSAWRENDRIRSEGAANIADAALASGVQILIQESFAFTYPDRGDNWIDEDTVLAPADYNRSVLDAERAVARFRERGGRGIVLRFAAFYGPDAMQIRNGIAALRLGWAPLPGNAQRYISSISHDDAAAAVVAALHSPAGTYTVSDDEPVRRGVYFGSLAACLGLGPPRFLPDWITPLFGTAGAVMARSLRLSNAKLRNATGWSPRFPSVRQGWPVMLEEMKDLPRH